MQKGFIIPSLLIASIIVIIIAGTLWTKITNKQSVNQGQITNQNSQAETIPSPFISPTPTVKPIHPENAIYLGTYKGFNVLFFTNKREQEYYEPGAIKKTNPNIGYARTDNPNGGVGQSFNFNKLENPKEIFTPPFTIQQINNFKFSDDKKTLYISLMLETKPDKRYTDNLENYIYRVDLNNLAYQTLWSFDLSPKKYKGVNGGASYINQASVDNNYLVLTLLNCFACSGTEAGLLILNNHTKAEKYFEKVGNVQFKLSEGVFTYQKLALFEEPCNDNEGRPCDYNSGLWKIYKPAGETFTEKLP